MIISTVIEILFAIFVVYGFFTLSKQLAFLIAFNKNIRKSVKLAVEIYDDDSDDTIKLKKFLAKKIALESFIIREYIVIEKKKEQQKYNV